MRRRIAVAWALTIAGVVVPLALIIASLPDKHAPWRLLAFAALLGIVGPSSGHFVLRRRIFTRGHVIRISTAVTAGLFVLGARDQDFGDAIAAILIGYAILVLGFIVGVATDIYDLTKWTREAK